MVQDRADAFDLSNNQEPKVAQSQKLKPTKIDLMDEMSDYDDTLNKAFSVLMLQQSEINQDLKGATLGSGVKEEDGTPQVQMLDKEDNQLEKMINQRQQDDGTPQVLVVKQHEEELEE